MRVGVCIWAKNEQKTICDWVSHYLYLGFDKIFIYDNMSSPPISETLEGAGLLREEVEIKIDDAGGCSHQYAVYQECIDQNKDLDWLLLCDADEFLWMKSIETGDLKIQDFLAAWPEDCCTILINWLTYGTGGLEKYDQDKTVFEQFTTRETYSHFWNNFVKSFVRPKLITKIGNVHITLNHDYKVYNVYRQVIEDAMKEGAECEFHDPELSDSTPMVMVHYMTLDYESMRIKQERNGAVFSIDDKYTLDWYTSCDHEDQRFKDDVEDTRMMERFRS